MTWHTVRGVAVGFVSGGAKRRAAPATGRNTMSGGHPGGKMCVSHATPWVRWERTVRAADDGGGWSWFLDKWWRHPERGSWGRKAHDQCKPRTVTAPAEADADGEGAVGGYVLSCEREEWYDNGGERVNDQWTEETECTGLLPQPAVPETEAKPEATADATTTSTVPLRKVRANCPLLVLPQCKAQ